jgi:thioredoxin reductase
MLDILIVGAGVTGLLAVSSFVKNRVEKIGIIDPTFSIGDLIEKYGSVQSNTSLQKTVNALKMIDPSYEPTIDIPLDKTAPLCIHSQLIKEFANKYLEKADCIQDTVLSIEHSDSIWKVKTKETIYESKVVLLCQGSEPKLLKSGISIIPLHIALNRETLKTYVSSKDKLLVFGTAHSGALILQNCEDLSVETTAVYKKEKPFYFANEGEYDGIKEDAEHTAKRILNNEFKYVKLLSIEKIDLLLKTAKQATKVIYAMGFDRREISISFNNENVDSKNYNKTNGLIATGLYGFGIAYPSSAPDDIHVDVGIVSFVEHILKQVPDIKNYLSQN